MSTVAQATLDVDPSAEGRKARLEQARRALAEAREIETVLLDVQARLPGLVRRVTGMCEQLEAAVGPIPEQEVSDDG